MVIPNNAGTILREPAANHPDDYWDKVLEVKGPVVFLASAASDFVSGEILTIDGGWMGR